MRELELFRNHLSQEREKLVVLALKVAAESTTSADYPTIVSAARGAALIAQLISDLRELDQDTGAFVKKFLQG